MTSLLDLDRLLPLEALLRLLLKWLLYHRILLAWMQVLSLELERHWEHVLELEPEFEHRLRQDRGMELQGFPPEP